MDSLLTHGYSSPLLVHEGRRNTGAVDDEVRHTNVVVDRLLAAREPGRFDLQSIR